MGRAGRRVLGWLWWECLSAHHSHSLPWLEGGSISLTGSAKVAALEQYPGPPRGMLSAHVCTQVLRAVSRPSPGVR